MFEFYVFLDRETKQITYKRGLKSIEMINWVLENMKNPDIQIWETVSEKYLAVSEKHDKLITSIRTVYAREYRKYSLNKEQTSINDLLDALRLSLKG